MKGSAHRQPHGIPQLQGKPAPLRASASTSLRWRKEVLPPWACERTKPDPSPAHHGRASKYDAVVDAFLPSPKWEMLTEEDDCHRQLLLFLAMFR